jgi:2-haloacid dehalogenase
MMLDMAKRASLPWDAILGAEVVRAYKPDAEVYERTIELLAMQPAEVCLVAAHNNDLAAARACGMRTAFVKRPSENGPSTEPPRAAQVWDVIAEDISDLATQVGA